MQTEVYSEIGKLKKVLVHAPGREVDIIVPEGANDLLFEDILFGERARVEHDIMCRVLQKYQVETFDVLELLESSFKNAGNEIVNQFIKNLMVSDNLSLKTKGLLISLSPKELAKALIEGVLLENSEMDDNNFYLVRPIPNLIFSRDPVIIAFDKVFSSSMAETVRVRESKLLTFIFTYHPEFKNPDNIIDLHQLSTEGSGLTLEGGDFLVWNEDTVAIAWSKRTGIKAIQTIASELRAVGVKNLIVAKLPPLVSFIHLDTVFTRINHDECLIYPPLFAKESSNRADILYFDLTTSSFVEKKYDYIFNLFDDLNIPMKPIYCGGKDSLIDQKREQWTQGSNAFAIAPGIILTYARNRKTIKELNDAGYLCINAKEVLSSSFTPNFEQKTAILLEGEELCRARGGPRCLTHPLVREKI